MQTDGRPRIRKSTWQESQKTRRKTGAAERSPEPFDKGLRVPRTQSPGAAFSVHSALRGTVLPRGGAVKMPHATARKWWGLPPQQGGAQHPTELRCGRPSRALEPPRGARTRGTLVTTHRSAPPLCPCPAALSEPVPALTGIRSEKQRFPQPDREGNVSWGDSRKWRDTFSGPPDYEWRWAGGFPDTFASWLFLVFPTPRGLTGGECSSGRGFQKEPRDPGSGWAGRRGARVAHTLSRPPCLAAPLRPGKEGAPAARPLHDPRTALSLRDRRGWERGGTGESLPSPAGAADW